MTTQPAKPKRRGHPTKLTSEFIKQMSQAIRLGLTQRSACAAYGIHETTLCRWLDKARDGKGTKLEREMLEAITRARDEGQLRMAALVAKAAETNPENARWFLERRFSEGWANKQRLALIDETARDEVRREVFEEVRRYLGEDAYAMLVTAIATNGRPTQ